MSPFRYTDSESVGLAPAAGGFALVRVAVLVAATLYAGFVAYSHFEKEPELFGTPTLTTALFALAVAAVAVPLLAGRRRSGRRGRSSSAAPL